MTFKKKDSKPKNHRTGSAANIKKQKSDGNRHRSGKINDVDADRHAEEQVVEMIECDFGYAYLG